MSSIIDNSREYKFVVRTVKNGILFGDSKDLPDCAISPSDKKEISEMLSYAVAKYLGKIEGGIWEARVRPDPDGGEHSFIVSAELK